MDRVAVMVDAGYFFAAGSELVSGTAKQKRSLLTLNDQPAIAALKGLAVDVTGGVPLLRIYWYDGAHARSGLSSEHLRLAHCNDVKLRLGFLNSVGEQKGVDSLIVTDLVELARNRAVSDVVVMSGDEDIRIGVVLAQSFGVRVHLVGIQPCRGTQSVYLMQEADTTTEWDTTVVKPLIIIRKDQPVPTTPAGAAKTIKLQGKIPEEWAKLHRIITELFDALQTQDISDVSQHLAANKNDLPRQFDSKLLARCRTILGRDLAAHEKRYVRDEFRKLIRQ